MNPRQAAIGEQGCGRAHGLAGGQVAVVRGHGELAGADPELQQPRIDVHECRAAGAGEQPRVDRIVKIQDQIGPSQHRLGLGLRATDEARRRGTVIPVAGHRVEERLALEPVPFHPLEEGREHGVPALGIAGGAELFQPVNLTAQASQP